VFRAAVLDFLQALGDTIRQAAARLCDPAEDGHPLRAARELDRRMQALRQAIGPLKRGWIALIPPRIRESVRIAMQSAYLARELAHAAETRPGATQGPQAEVVRTRADALLRDIEALREVIRASGRNSEPPPWIAPMPAGRAGWDGGAGQVLAIGGDAVAPRAPLRLLDGLADALRRFRQMLAGDTAAG
jgi:hypothetical protein